VNPEPLIAFVLLHQLAVFVKFVTKRDRYKRV
jgi:hypothetical protein